MSTQELLRPGQAALRLGVSRHTVSDWIRDGKIEVVRTQGGHARIPVENLPDLADLAQPAGAAGPAQKTGWLKSSDVSKILAVSPKTVSRMAAEGKLPFGLTLGGHRRFPQAEILALAEQLGLR